MKPLHGVYIAAGVCALIGLSLAGPLTGAFSAVCFLALVYLLTGGK